MSDDHFDSFRLHNCLDRWRAGERDAADELFRAVGDRLERLARKMVRRYPAVREWDDPLDVLQAANLRLLHSLRTVAPGSVSEFVNFAAVHIRRELIDRARRYANKWPPRGPADLDALPHSTEGQDDLDLWQHFHEAVERLPAEDREVVGLIFYHGWTQHQVAECLGVSDRTVSRHWASACHQVRRLAGDPSSS